MKSSIQANVVLMVVTVYAKQDLFLQSCMKVQNRTKNAGFMTPFLTKILQQVK